MTIPGRSVAALVLFLALAGRDAPAPSPGPAGLPIQAAASRLSFTIHRPGESIEGTAKSFTGEVSFDPTDPSRGSVVLRVEAASLETGNRLRDHKMRDSHLEVEKFPQIVFKSTSVQAGSGKTGGSQRKLLLEGVLSLHGVDRTIIVPVTVQFDGGALTAEGSTRLTYSDFKIPIPRFLWLVMDDDIQIQFHIVAGAAVHGAGG